MCGPLGQYLHVSTARKEVCDTAEATNMQEPQHSRKNAVAYERSFQVNQFEVSVGIGADPITSIVFRT